MLQHDAVHIQHAHYAQRESEHTLFISYAVRHVRICRKTFDAGSISRYS